ncbi:hypothetical protein [Clostridium gasigenes]|uniref:Spore coat protein n=1 Tax=Clostridium gasigenes TaxID=94869 RepID=A0A1H0VSX7_9CLOT|nr:hypothetical protein [Clostridium gasigenes]MBB6622532.1 hypothetical protein [Clostridium gasigenes]MBB6714179.1 hypothetical protein [Clostridium gasigenes]MBU3088512.1 hypothetical protein [Clostridium gasigenes]SDP81682.1 hypothetical protein SAMN04488529_11931 [Clostridium gasigenes]
MDNIDNNLYSYFTKRDIKLVNHSFENRGEISLESIKRQISNIVVFQNNAKGYKDNILPRIGSSIGRDLEGYKVQVKNLELDLDYITDKIDKNSVDIFILEEGEMLLSRGRRAINHVENSNYSKLIRRSMANYEVCLGRVCEGNLRMDENGKVEIGTIKYLTYNLVEHDFYSYLKRLRKKNNILDIECLIKYFAEKSLLKDDSIEYLRGLLSYPVESLKLWEKYRINKKNLTEEEYMDGFYKAKKNDGKELIAREYEKNNSQREKIVY